MVQSKIIDNRYKIIETITKSGFGIIHKGYDIQHAIPVSIKEIKSEYLEDAKYIDMFIDEALTTAKLSHPNILKINEQHRTDDNRFFIIMEYIDGVDLGELLKKCKQDGRCTPEPLSLYIVSEVCKALHHAHLRNDPITGEQLQIIHRDISPSNIMLSYDGFIKVIDFGIAKHSKRVSDETQKYEIKGKLAYMAPEQIYKPKDIDHRADLFSLGVVLYETLAGEKLFWDDSSIKLMAIVAGAKIERIKFEKLNLTPELEKIIKKAVKQKPKDRYQSAKELLDDLYGYLREINENTGELGFRLSEFLHDIFSERIEKKQARFDKTTIQEENSELIRTKPILKGSPAGEAPTVIKLPSPGSVESLKIDQTIVPVAVQKEEPIRTIIDNFKLPTDYKRYFKTGSIIFGVLVVLLFMADIKYMFTPPGKWLHTIFFPPSLELSTFPEDADVFLDEKKLAYKTPYTVNNISPGSHELKFVLKGFMPIISSVIIPNRGIVTTPPKYLFQSKYRIESDPAAATVYIDGKEHFKKTPFDLNWDVSKKLHLEMELQDFDKISGFEFEFNEDPYIIDNRVWDHDTKRLTDQLFNPLIIGKFYKKIVINTNPQQADIFIEGENRSLGVTNKDTIPLTLGVYKIILKKDGYLEKPIDLIVSPMDNKLQTYSLFRQVMISVLDRSSQKDLNAEVHGVSRRVKTSPSIFTLGPRTYFPRIYKSGYIDTTISINVRRLNSHYSKKTVYMRKQPDGIIVEVYDLLTLKPIISGEILYRRDTDTGQFKKFGNLNSNGSFSGKLSEGVYQFKAVCKGYKDEIIEKIVVNPVHHFEISMRKLPN